MFFLSDVSVRTGVKYFIISGEEKVCRECCHGWPGG